MADLGAIRKVTASDTSGVSPFRYIQAGVSGTISLKTDSGAIVQISSALLDKMAVVPVGVSVQVMASGTTASDIYVWS